MLRMLSDFKRRAIICSMNIFGMVVNSIKPCFRKHLIMFLNKIKLKNIKKQKRLGSFYYLYDMKLQSCHILN